MKKKIISAAVFFSLLLNSSPAQAITFGNEVISASSQYSYVISVWHSESPEIPPRFICTGTLIDSTVVLTAAHCLLDDRGIPLKGAFFVKYGNNLLQDGSLREVSATWYSPQYSVRQNTADIGLLRLSYPATGVQVLPLASATQMKKIMANKKTTYEAVGWGIDQNRNMATYLKRVVVKDESIYVSKRVKWWKSAIWFAAGKYDTKQKVYGGVCSGDSGGPVFATTNGQRVQVGITMATFAEDCELLAPSIFTRISYYVNHIKENINTLENNQLTQNKAFPSVIEEPKIIGTATAGSTITCDKGRWSSNTTNVIVRWSEYGKTYNATSLILSDTYSPRTFQCTVIGTNASGEVKRVLTIVQPTTPTKPSTPYPSISGISSYSNTTVGTVAQCSASSYSSDAVMSYQWGYGTSSYVSSLSNPLGSGSTLTISQSILDAVKGKYLICQATATNSAGSATGYTTQSVTGPTPTPTPTPTPSATPTPTPSATPTPTPSATPTPTPSATPAPTPSATPTPTPSATPTPTPSATPTLSAARQELINGNLNTRTGLVDAPISGLCKPGSTHSTSPLFPANPGDDFYVWWGASTIYYDVNTAVSNDDFFSIGWFNNRDAGPATITITDAQWAQLNGKFLVVRTSYNYARFRGFEPYGYSSIVCRP